jgi:hypothetical protein
MHWSEAVAVLAELCAVLLGLEVQVIPHAADVLINGGGKLSLRTADSGDSNSAALGRMLHDLLATASPPAPLRLFVSQAISSDRYQTVSALATGLASYEVPGRNKQIQALYDRWVAMRTESAAAPVEIPMRLEPEPEKQPESKARARRLPRWAIATIGVAVVLSGSAGAWLAAGAKVPSIPPISLSSLSSSAPAIIQRALAWVSASEPSHVAAAETDTANTKRTHATKRRSSAAPASTSNPELDAATAIGFTGATPATGSIAAADPTKGPDGVTSNTGVVGDRSAPAAADTAELADSGETPGALEDVATVADATVYSRAFPGVVPPVIMPHQIAAPDALSPRVETISTIEILVDESGEVEQVKLLSRPSPILATMLLSAAKTWKFKPALNDGRPVKYRLLLDVMTTRP